MGKIITDHLPNKRVEFEEISDLSTSTISSTSSDIDAINIYTESMFIASKYNLSIDICNSHIILKYNEKSIGSFKSISNLFYFLKGYQYGIITQSK